MSNTPEYQKGYQAGRKRSARDVEELKQMRLALDERNERVYMKSLELALKHCGDWRIGKKPINDAEGYCKLAKIFADNSISILDK